MDRLADLTEKMKRLEAHGDGLKLVWCLARHQGRFEEAHATAARMFPRTRVGEMIRLAAVAPGDTTTSGWASELALTRFLGELVSVLNAGSLLSLPWRRAAFNTRTLTDSSGGSAAWVGEGAPVPASKFSLDAVDLDQKKVAGLLFLSDEVLETWTPATANQLNLSLSASIGRAVDNALLDPEYDAVAGLRPASLTNGLSPIATPAATEAGVTAAVKAALQDLVDGGSDLRNVVVVMSPVTALTLSTMLTAGNVRAFPNLGVRGGEIFGLPVTTTPGAVSTGSPLEYVTAVIDPTQCLVADDGGVDFAASKAAAVQMESAPTDAATNTVSMFQTSTTAIRFRRWFNFARCFDQGAVAYFRTTF